MAFVHLHNHTQYSLLDGACRIDKMVEYAKELGMKAVAMTDHGNMFGTIDFFFNAKKNNIKPIIGIEAYIVNTELDDPEGKKSPRYHLVLLAKNNKGYHNLMKMSSESFINGFYYKPRISKSLLRKYSDGVIALSACVQGEIPRLLLNDEKEKAYDALNEYKTIFRDDFYIEIQNHGLDKEKLVAPELVEMARKTNTKLVVTNDCHYLRKEDSDAHDILLCIQTGKSFNDENRMKYETSELYFKSEEEMRALFPDLPDAYENTVKIADSIDFELDYNDFLLPKIDIPGEFLSQGEYLRYICEENLSKKYDVITDEIKERLSYELSVINKMGYEGYFLVVKDFIDVARKENVPVGPGRGSAAGSIVSFLLGITQIDPLKYGLLFERFLTEDRIGMPDIDIDFCAEGRQTVLDYVVEKYGRDCVTQIVTFGTLGAKVAVKDVARVLDVSAVEANKMTKLIPDRTDLVTAMKESKEFRDYMNQNDTYKKVIKNATILEGLIRQIGVHACGVVIAPQNLSNYIPLAVSGKKGQAPAIVSQFEGKWLDDLKLLKMDFLGLKTLTLIKKTILLIKTSRNIEFDVENVDLNDNKTYELLSKGKTDGVFQFESAGMKKYMIELQPTVFEDLIVMVALYRPGPMQFITNYINRKHGNEKVNYDHPLTESALKETYGVTVYQEQVMKISRVMGGFSASEADKLRKAIAKKKLAMMEKLGAKFKKGAMANGVSEKIVNNIWDGWLEFANYAFNKSHAACYAYVAYQTAYLKAHYPVEFMAALLSLEEKPEKIPYFITECKNMKIEVISPKINESFKEFSVIDNKILFGLKGIKNVGDVAIQNILKERMNNGKFIDLFDFCKRIDKMIVNKATIESLIMAGSLDDLPGNRAQKVDSIETAIEFAYLENKERESGQLSLLELFDKQDVDENIKPKLKKIDEWNINLKLSKEKEVLGFFISGHPLNSQKHLIDLLTNSSSIILEDENVIIPKKISIIGIIVKVNKKIDSKGNPMAFVTMEDMFGKFELSLFSKNYNEFFHLLIEGEKIFVEGKRSNWKTEDSMLRIIVNKIIEIENLNKKLKGEVYCKIYEKNINAGVANKLKKIAINYPGQFNVCFNVVTEKFGELKLFSRSTRIFPSNEVLSFITNDLNAVPTAKINYE